MNNLIFITFTILALSTGCTNPMGGGDGEPAKSSIDSNFLHDAFVTKNVSISLRENMEQVVNLPFTGSLSSIAVSCQVSNLSNLVVTDGCVCMNQSCNVKIKGTLDFIGVAGLDFTVTDDKEYVSLPAHLEANVFADNIAPVLTQMGDLSVFQGQSVTQSITVSDVDSPNMSCTNLSATSSFQSLVADSDITISGTYPNCEISIHAQAAQRGLDTITVVVNDNDSVNPKSDTKTFNVSVYYPPSVPQSLIGSMAQNTINLTWNSSVTGFNPITYNVLRGNSSGSYSPLATSSAANFTDSTATAGSTYFYVVSAVNADGTSTNSNEVSVSTLGNFAINSLTSTATTSTTGSVNLSWDSSTNATAYDIYSKNSLAGTYAVTSSGLTSTSTTITGLTSGSTMYYVVRAKNSSGYLDSVESHVTVLGLFSDHFDFASTLAFSPSSGAEIDSGKGKLSVSNLVTEKTSDGTGTASNVLLETYALKDTNLTVSGDKVQMTSGTTGEYVSMALDGKNSNISLESLSFQTSIPFGKEISTTAETGYQSAVTNFSTGLTALWRFNETTGYTGVANELQDSVGSNHGKLFAGTVTSSVGKFNNSSNFPSSGTNVLSVPTSTTLDGTNKLTISTWVYPTILDNNPRAIISKRKDVGDEASYSVFFYTGNHLGIDIDSNGDRFSTVKVFTPNNWYHIVVVFDGTKVFNQRVQVFVNGTLDSTAGETSTTIPNYNSPVWFGSMNNAYGFNYSGLIDETAIWKNRSLTASEVLELYRRGANRVKLQVRTCSAVSGADCSGSVSPWTGPDGGTTTYFGENLNHADPLNLLSAVGNSFFHGVLNTFGAGLTSWMTTNGSKQYVQYKATFKSDSSSVFPDLYKVLFTSGKSRTESATINATVAMNYKKITSMTITQSCSDVNANTIDDDIRYDFSFDNGSNYYSWNGSAWAVSNSFSSASSKSSIEALTQTQFNLAPSQTGNLLVRAYLTSTGNTSCEVDDIQVNGIR